MCMMSMIHDHARYIARGTVARSYLTSPDARSLYAKIPGRTVTGTGVFSFHYGIYYFIAVLCYYISQVVYLPCSSVLCNGRWCTPYIPIKNLPACVDSNFPGNCHGHENSTP